MFIISQIFSCYESSYPLSFGYVVLPLLDFAKPLTHSVTVEKKIMLRSKNSKPHLFSFPNTPSVPAVQKKGFRALWGQWTPCGHHWMFCKFQNCFSVSSKCTNSILIPVSQGKFNRTSYKFNWKDWFGYVFMESSKHQFFRLN